MDRPTDGHTLLYRCDAASICKRVTNGRINPLIQMWMHLGRREIDRQTDRQTDRATEGGKGRQTKGKLGPILVTLCARNAYLNRRNGPMDKTDRQDTDGHRWTDTPSYRDATEQRERERERERERR